jgi:hypothetical protein
MLEALWAVLGRADVTVRSLISIENVGSGLAFYICIEKAYEAKHGQK